MAEYYTVMYNGINLYAYEMTPEEKDTVESFRKELIDLCDTLNVPRGKCFGGSPYMGRLLDNCDYLMKYKEGTGYFVLQGERGIFELQKGFPAKEKHEAMYIVLGSEFISGGYRYELENRSKLESDWAQKYEMEYDSRKAAFEYAIQSLKTVFQAYPEKTIDSYTQYMNKWFDNERWYFDKDSMLFEVNSTNRLKSDPL